MNTKSRFVLGVSALALLVGAGCAQGGGNGTSGSGGNNSASGGNQGSGGSSSGGSTGSGGNGSGSGGNTGSGGSSTSSGGNTGSGGSSTSSGGNTGSGGASTSSGGSTGTGGAAGAPAVKECATKTTIMTPVFMNFENYTGMGTMTADNYSTGFGTTTVNTGTAYAGFFQYPEATGSTAPTLSMVGGHPPSTWAAGETLSATMWGMGGGIWMGCADASAYKGISFWVRGTSGTGTFSFTLSMDSTDLPNSMNAAMGGICPGTADTCKPAEKDNIPITTDWTQVSILWSDFTPGTSGTASVTPNGNNITGLGWSVPLAFIADPSKAADAGVYIPVPATVTFNIDDITFMQ